MRNIYIYIYICVCVCVCVCTHFVYDDLFLENICEFLFELLVG